MYAYHKYIFWTRSAGFRPIHSRTSSITGTQILQNIFCYLFWMNKPWTRSWGRGSKMVSTTMDFIGFHEKLQLQATPAPWCRRVWECWDTFLITTPRDLSIQRELVLRESRHAFQNRQQKYHVLHFCSFGDVSVPIIRLGSAGFWGLSPPQSVDTGYIIL